MKSILEFNLPEERDEHTLAIRGGKYFSTLHNLDQKLRSIIKHGHDYSSVEALATDLRQYINEHINFEEVS